jgi:hypothetical protein
MTSHDRFKDGRHVVPGVELLPLWKHVDERESSWIPCNGQHDFGKLNHASFSFRHVSSLVNPDKLLIGG